MEERLRKNICGLDNHAILTEVEDLSIRQKEHIGEALEYSCRFWAKHLAEVPSDGHDVDKVHRAIEKFFTTHLLFWIEVLTIMDCLGVSVYSIIDIQQWYISVSCIHLFAEVCVYVLFRQV